MKKVLLTLSVALISTATLFAQGDKKKSLKSTTPSAIESINETTKMKYESETHDFGNVKEGDKAEYDFVFKNTGKEPIVLQRVSASCGCTTPSYSQEPIKPGKKGTIKVAYATAGRPGPISKSVTVVTNTGTATLYIKGNVEKKPTSSVPETSSVMKSK